MYLKIISGRAQDRAILLSSRIHPILEVLALKVCSISSHTSLFFLVLASWFVCNVKLFKWHDVLLNKAINVGLQWGK